MTHDHAEKLIKVAETIESPLVGVLLPRPHRLLLHGAMPMTRNQRMWLLAAFGFSLLMAYAVSGCSGDNIEVPFDCVGSSALDCPTSTTTSTTSTTQPFLCPDRLPPGSKGCER